MGLLRRRVVLHPPSKAKVRLQFAARAILFHGTARIVRYVFVPRLISPSVGLGARVVLWLVRHAALESHLRFVPQNIQIVNGTVQIAEALVLWVAVDIAHVHVPVAAVQP